MWSHLRLQPSTAIATLALFVALGGTSYAIGNTINGSHLKNGSVAGKKLIEHTVTGTQVKVSTFPTVPSAHLADDATSLTGSIAGSQVSSPVANATKAANLTGNISGSQVNSAVANATDATNAQTAAVATSLGQVSYVRASVGNISAGTTNVFPTTATCPSGSAVIGTGFTGLSVGESVLDLLPETTNSAPVPNTVAATVYNGTGGTLSGGFVIAICAAAQSASNPAGL